MTFSKKDKSMFHPFELGFVGYSNSGKTTLITRLLKKLTDKYSIAYVKHDAHCFKMDREGKDTEKAWRANASQVLISDSTHHARIASGPFDPLTQKMELRFSDFVIVEGYKQSTLDKIVLVDSDENILDEIRQKRITNILALVGQGDSSPLANYPYFHRDDIEGISTFMLQELKKQAQSAELFALVLAGGYSKRMKQDKALLNYHGKTQLDHTMDLLNPFCSQAFVSKREEQAFKEHPAIYDSFLNMGPLGGIVSAMTRFPQAAWLVVACDLPLLDKRTLEYLIEERDPFKMATAYLNTEGTFPEPLCAIYEPRILLQLLSSFSVGMKCPKKILRDSSIKSLKLPYEQALMNVNTPDELQLLQGELCQQ